MQFNKQWKEYLIESRWPGFLLEARLKDVKAKYPVLEASGWINWGQRQINHLMGPKGVSKYLMWFAREADRIIGSFADPDEIRSDPDVLEMCEAILDHVMLFDQNQHKFEEKDIYKYHDEEIKRELDKLGVTTSAKAQKATADKKQAEENSEVIYADHGVFAIRPLTEQASCYYGQNPRLTDWCISEPEKRNYFVQYTEEEGKVFVMSYFYGLQEGHPNHLITLEFDQDGDLTMLHDAPNKAQNPDDLWDIIREHLDGMPDYKGKDEGFLKNLNSQIYHDITSSAKQSVEDNPPPDTLVATQRACELIQNEADEDLEHITPWFEIEQHPFLDRGDAHVSYGATMQIDIDTRDSLFSNTERSLESIDFKESRELSGAIWARLDQAGYAGFEEIRIENDHGDIAVFFQLKQGLMTANDVEGFREFCAFTLSSAQKDHDDMLQLINSVFTQRGYRQDSRPQRSPHSPVQESRKPLTKNSFYDKVEMSLNEEKGRSRQRGIYKFYCMLTYSLTLEENKTRGLDDILADLRALPNVTIVTVVIKNQKIADGRYIAGLSIKFIPSIPGQFRSPEDVKVRILRDVRRLSNVKTLFKVSAGLERLE
jgi:hypothetical protein